MAGELAVATELSPWERFKAEPVSSMAELCAALSEGKSLRACSRELGVSMWRLWEWLNETPERAGQYARACEVRAVHYAGVIEELSDEPIRRNDKGNLDPADVAHKRLKLDALKWTASKLNPKRYGDKLDVDAKVTVDATAELREFLKGGSRLPINGAT